MYVYALQLQSRYKYLHVGTNFNKYSATIAGILFFKSMFYLFEYVIEHYFSRRMKFLAYIANFAKFSTCNKCVLKINVVTYMHI
jgi:hypothetical protein